MIDVKFRFKGSCPKHPRYNPALQGRGAIKAGCVICVELARIEEYVRQAGYIAKAASIFIDEEKKRRQARREHEGQTADR